jgi:hypothetical protein
MVGCTFYPPTPLGLTGWEVRDIRDVREDQEVGEDNGSSRKSWKWDFWEDQKVQEVREVNEVLVVQNKRDLWEARGKTRASVEPVNPGRSTEGDWMRVWVANWGTLDYLLASLEVLPASYRSSGAVFLPSVELLSKCKRVNRGRPDTIFGRR